MPKKTAHKLTSEEQTMLDAMVSIAKVMKMEGEFSAAYDEKKESLMVFLYERPAQYFYIAPGLTNKSNWFDILHDNMHKLVG